MDMFYLVKSRPNWADEIDFDGFDLLSEDEYQNALEQFEKKTTDWSNTLWPFRRRA